MKTNETNIIQRMTGATIALVSAGSNVTLKIEGSATLLSHPTLTATQRASVNAGQVCHAMTLLYNYHAIGDWPEWYDSEAQQTFRYMELTVTQRGFKRGLLALVYTQETERRHKRDVVARCTRAVIRTARQLHLLGLRIYKPMPDLSHVGTDSES